MSPPGPTFLQVCITPLMPRRTEEPGTEKQYLFSSFKFFLNCHCATKQILSSLTHSFGLRNSIRYQNKGEKRRKVN